MEFGLSTHSDRNYDCRVKPVRLVSLGELIHVPRAYGPQKEQARRPALFRPH